MEPPWVIFDALMLLHMGNMLLNCKYQQQKKIRAT